MLETQFSRVDVPLQNVKHVPLHVIGSSLMKMANRAMLLKPPVPAPQTSRILDVIRAIATCNDLLATILLDGVDHTLSSLLEELCAGIKGKYYTHECLLKLRAMTEKLLLLPLEHVVYFVRRLNTFSKYSSILIYHQISQNCDVLIDHIKSASGDIDGSTILVVDIVDVPVTITTSLSIHEIVHKLELLCVCIMNDIAAPDWVECLLKVGELMNLISKGQLWHLIPQSR